MGQWLHVNLKIILETVLFSSYSSIYRVKYGIIEVDFDSENKTRTPRMSADWFQTVARDRYLGYM